MKQTNDCTICGPLSVTLADIDMFRIKTHVVVATQPISYKWYIDDIYNCHQNTFDEVHYDNNCW